MKIQPVNFLFRVNNSKQDKSINYNYHISQPLKNDVFVSSVKSEGISFSGKTDKKKDNFKLNLSTDELKFRTDKNNFNYLKLLDKDAPEYQKLAPGDKEALKHLVKAAYYADIIALKQDNKYNLPFAKYLEEEIAKGSKDAELTKILFDGMKSVSGMDYASNYVNLVKGVNRPKGRGFFPQDLSAEEFQAILKSMLEENRDDEVRALLSQRTVVKRDSQGGLKAVDYTDEYKTEFSYIADELEEAAKTSTNKDFNSYLRAQALALRENDPYLDAKADMKWAKLQDTPLEFTIVREGYEEEISDKVSENKELSEMLKKHNIVLNSKDSLGIRVGIVNKDGTDKIIKIKEFLPLLAENMPYKDSYEQNITSKEEDKQAMVDVDLVTLSGYVGAWNGGIVIAENLPNDDKLSVQLGGGRRNVYHRQIRNELCSKTSEHTKKKLDLILKPELHKYCTSEGEHYEVVGHENAHSLGPKNGTEALGKYRLIIEENKADMGAIAFLDLLTDKGFYTEEQKKEIITSFVVEGFLKAKPDMTQPHRVRSVMQTYYFMKEGAIKIDKDGLIDIDYDKFVPTARKMLTEIIEVQLSKDIKRGEKYVKDYFHWTNDMEKIAKKINSADNILNGTLVTPLADYLMEQN